MRIQHNIAALNSYRNLTSNNASVSKNLEKLSSGYRINRAGDDAAGLAISEKMRAQVTGLKTAQKNANDGISLIQTAEGALTEVHSMLNRMVELADQSANGTYQDAVDRQNLQKEMNSLRDEIDRISEGTNFNGINLLDGSLGGGNSKVAPEVSADWSTPPTMTRVEARAGKYTDQTAAKHTAGEIAYNIEYTDEDGTAHTTSVKFTAVNDADKDGMSVAAAINGDKDLSALFIATSDTYGKVTLTAKQKGTGAAKVTGMGFTATAPDTTDLENSRAKDAGIRFSSGMRVGDSLTVDGKTYKFTGNDTDAVAGVYEDEAAVIRQLKIDGYKVVDDDGRDSDTLASCTITKDPEASNSAGLTLQIGDTAESFNQLTVSVGSMSSASLGLSAVDISSQSGAKKSVDMIKKAINTVSSTRGDLGALQNRLEHTINNLSVTTENMTAAESRIRDVDMADEMMNYTKNNILVQASQAMLAQANQLPQGVLQLLQ